MQGNNSEYYKGVIGKIDFGVKIVEVPPVKPAPPNRAQRRAAKRKVKP